MNKYDSIKGLTADFTFDRSFDHGVPSIMVVAITSPVIDINQDGPLWSCLQDLTGRSIRNPAPELLNAPFCPFDTAFIRIDALDEPTEAFIQALKFIA